MILIQESKNLSAFWANAEVAPIEDVKGYNRAGHLGRVWCLVDWMRWAVFTTKFFQRKKLPGLRNASTASKKNLEEWQKS